MTFFFFFKALPVLELTIIDQDDLELRDFLVCLQSAGIERCVPAYLVYDLFYMQHFTETQPYLLLFVYCCFSATRED